MLTREEKLSYCKRHGYSAEYANYWADHDRCECGCGGEAMPPHHIITRGALGVDDQPENLIALCYVCHSAIHTLGRDTFAKRFPEAAEKIREAKERVGLGTVA